MDAHENDSGRWTGALHGPKVCSQVGPYRFAVVLKASIQCKKAVHVEADDNDSSSVVVRATQRLPIRLMTTIKDDQIE